MNTSPSSALPTRQAIFQWLSCLILVGTSSWAGNFLAGSGDGRIASVWLANGILIGTLYTLPASRWAWLLLAGFLGNATANLLSGQFYPAAMTVALVNSFEILLISVCIRKFVGEHNADLMQWRAANTFMLFGVFLGPLAGGLLAASYLHDIQDAHFETVLGTWYASHALGTGIVAPVVMTWARESQYSQRTVQTSDWWALLLLMTVTMAVFSVKIAAISFLVLPPLMIAVFKHGQFGAAGGIALISAIAIPLTAMGHGPFAAVEGVDERQRVVLLQLFIAVSSLLAFGAAFVLKQRSSMLARLTQAEKDLRTITANVPALIAHVDAEERFVFINRTTFSIYSLNPDKDEGRCVAECIGEAPYASLKPKIDQALRGERVEFEQLLPSDKGSRYHRVSYVPEFGNDGEVRGFYATSIDISDMKYAEAQIEKSERWLRNVTDHIPTLVAYIGRNERISFANRQFQDILQTNPDELIGKSLMEYLGVERHRLIADKLKRAFAGEQIQFEQSLPRKGETEHYLINWVPDIDPEGRVLGFFSAATNITSRKVSEMIQAASEARIRTMTDGLPGLIAYLDRNGIIRFCNAAYERWFGLTPDQMIGKTMDEALGDIITEPQTGFINRALQDERVETEFDAEARERYRSLQAIYLPHRDESGRVLGVYTLASDITPLKRMQGELQQQARYDTLTGLPNRAQFNIRLAQSLRHSEESGEPIALMFIDVDRFKLINDSYGHATGDAVLQEIAGRLKGCIGKNDTVARLSGDEFVIILESPHEEHAPEYIARDVLSSMSAPIIFGDVEVTAGLSLGIALNTEPGMQASQLLANADKALYRAKAAGRGSYAVHEAEAQSEHSSTEMVGHI